MVKSGARLKDVCDEGLGFAIRKAYDRLLTEELHVAQIKPVYWLFPVGSKVVDISTPGVLMLNMNIC